MTKGDVEIDSILERPNHPLSLIEIKSSQNVQREDLSSFVRISRDTGRAKAYCFPWIPKKNARAFSLLALAAGACGPWIVLNDGCLRAPNQ
jgi:hypothetical protein